MHPHFPTRRSSDLAGGAVATGWLKSANIVWITGARPTLLIQTHSSFLSVSQSTDVFAKSVCKKGHATKLSGAARVRVAVPVRYQRGASCPNRKGGFK